MTSRQTDALQRKEATDNENAHAFAQDYPEVAALLARQGAEFQALLQKLGLTNG